ncbi:dienelactone hydrolase family protein [Cerasicoccus frondis]|uniref:dienelactone hydrolase family protein n=1 Tax=Cerasicoccus frondis TaxID=490090 RepID=UPI0028526AAE|nr:dienelactone hydrolase family protein [Cerasicoccus frondis]
MKPQTTELSFNPEHQASRRRELYGLLGDLPPRSRQVSGKQIAVESTSAYTLESLILDLNGEELVPAYFALPRGHTSPCPVVLYNHAHGGDYTLGKDELRCSRKELMPKPYLDDLIEHGFAVLCIDHWLFGERSGRDELDFCKEMLWRGRTPWGMMVYDSIKALDYLEMRPEIDSKRIGALGLSMGSTMTWWLAALDGRIKAGADLCCLTDFDSLLAEDGLCEHSLYYYVPGLLKHFSTADICALAAPRARLALAGSFDPLTPVAGLKRIDEALSKLYAKANYPDHWRLEIFPQGHQESQGMRDAAIGFLLRYL